MIQSKEDMFVTTAGSDVLTLKKRILVLKEHGFVIMAKSFLLNPWLSCISCTTATIANGHPNSKVRDTHFSSLKGHGYDLR